MFAQSTVEDGIWISSSLLQPAGCRSAVRPTGISPEVLRCLQMLPLPRQVHALLTIVEFMSYHLMMM